MEATDLKVLHIWEQGISSTIAKYMDRIYGTRSWVIHRAKYDPYGQVKRGASYKCRASEFKLRALLSAMQSDVVHIHSADTLIPSLKHTGKPLVMQYHGTEIRDKWDLKESLWSKADTIIVATRNLLQGAPSSVIYQPNPVDTENFYPTECRVKERAVHFSYDADDLAIQIANSAHIPLEILQRNIPYSQMPDMLREYTHFIDVKRDEGKVLTSRPDDTGSLLGLEALACGLKVLTLTGMRQGLPEVNRPENVVSNLFKIYGGLV